MSAAPSAIFGEWETMTIPTFATCLASNDITYGRYHQRRGSRPGIHMSDGAIAEERGTAADRLHRHRRLGRREGACLDARTQAVAAGTEFLSDGNQHVEHGLLSGLRFAAHLDRLDRAGEGARSRGRLAIGGNIPCKSEKEGSVKRAPRTPHLHYQHRPHRPSRPRERA